MVLQQRDGTRCACPVPSVSHTPDKRRYSYLYITGVSLRRRQAGLDSVRTPSSAAQQNSHWQLAVGWLRVKRMTAKGLGMWGGVKKAMWERNTSGEDPIRGCCPCGATRAGRGGVRTVSYSPAESGCARGGELEQCRGDTPCCVGGYLLRTRWAHLRAMRK